MNHCVKCGRPWNAPPDTCPRCRNKEHGEQERPLTSVPVTTEKQMSKDKTNQAISRIEAWGQWAVIMSWVSGILAIAFGASQINAEIVGLGWIVVGVIDIVFGYMLSAIFQWAAEVLRALHLLTRKS
jgi:hypothetical protein